MRPIDVPTRDWNLYYNHTIMNHEGMGVIQITVADRMLHGRKHDNDRWRPVDAAILTCLWPRSCAVNWQNRGLYIARRSRREARRSATIGHYYIAYGLVGRGMSNPLLSYMCMPNEYPSMDFAYEAIISNSRESIAITPELILIPSVDGCGVVYKTDVAGSLVRSTDELDNASYVFTPSYDSTPAAKRAAFRFQKEGILCQ